MVHSPIEPQEAHPTHGEEKEEATKNVKTWPSHESEEVTFKSLTVMSSQNQVKVQEDEARKIARVFVDLVGQLITSELYFINTQQPTKARKARKAIEDAKAAHRLIAGRFGFHTYP